jgi:hypothetical protein
MKQQRQTYSPTKLETESLESNILISIPAEILLLIIIIISFGNFFFTLSNVLKKKHQKQLL